MNRTTQRLGTSAISLWNFDHGTGTAHCDPEHEVAESASITFVDGGSFDVRAAGESWTLGPGRLFVTPPSYAFSCSHDCEVPTDRCLSVRFSDRAVEDLLSADVPSMRPPVAVMSSRHVFLRHRLEQCVPGEEVRLELLAGALFESLGAAGTGPQRVRSSTDTTDVMRRIARAMERVESEYAQPITLADLAATAGMSAFHFARVFRSCVGVPPHRYLTAVRLRHAAHRLDQGASVTSTCLEVGFGSLSHFVTAFSRRFGVNPSQARHGARPAAFRSALSAPIWSRRSH